METWNEEVFHPQLFELALFSHPALNANPLFKEIRETFSNYNQEVLGVEVKVNQEHVKSVKMTQLFKVMINVMEVDDKEIQLSSLRKAHQWMKENLKVEPDKYESIKGNLRAPTLPNKVELPRIPSNQIQEEVRDYHDGFRSYHNYAPKDRIKYYKRRQLNFEESFKIIPKKDTKEAKKNKIKYEKPQSEFGFDVEEEGVAEGN